jgi:hypothetical protein
MKDSVIRQDDWVLICETGEKAKVVCVFDEGERFLLMIPQTEEVPFERRVHIMVEKIRKIRPPKQRIKWFQTTLF